MVAISAFCVTQHSQIFSLFFGNQIQCIALYQLHNSQALLNLRRGYFSVKFEKFIVGYKLMKLCNIFFNLYLITTCKVAPGLKRLPEFCQDVLQ